MTFRFEYFGVTTADYITLFINEIIRKMLVDVNFLDEFCISIIGCTCFQLRLIQPMG